jgi:hypothetical protein
VTEEASQGAKLTVLVLEAESKEAAKKAEANEEK